MFGKLKTAITDPKLVAKRLSLRAGKLIGTRRYGKFIVLTRSRTGSNMLLGMLNSHHSIAAAGEVFGQLRGRNFDQILSSVFCRYPHNIKAVGFKIFYYHPMDDDSGMIWPKLRAIEDLCVVHLRRRNVLRTLLSRKIAGQTDLFASKRGSAAVPLQQRRVSFTRQELLNSFQQTRKWENDFDDVFRSNKRIDVYYEDLVAAPQEHYTRITNTLGVQDAVPRTRLRKQNPERLSELIVDYHRMKESFHGTQWAPFFED